MKLTTTTVINGCGEPIIVNTLPGKCRWGHMWTFAGKRDYIPEGTPCDCGLVKYSLLNICKHCGQTT